MGMMIYKGVVKDKVIVLEKGVLLPEGTQVDIIPCEESEAEKHDRQKRMRAWLANARKVRAKMSLSGDSVEILRELRVWLGSYTLE